MWDLIVSVADHCLSVYFDRKLQIAYSVHLLRYRLQISHRLLKKSGDFVITLTIKSRSAKPC